MKYIRTKEELYEVMPKQICNTDKFVEVQRKKIGLFTGTTELISKDDIVKQADTIEELCDEFILIKNDYHEHYAKLLEDERGMYLTNYSAFSGKQYFTLRPEISIYGAIWTDKGLIYVAKMNDKGELKLL